MQNTQLFPMIVKTLPGLEDVLEKELEKLGAEDIEKLRLAVRFQGDLSLLYTANLELRTALRVLVPIKEFTASSTASLYEAVREIPWEKYIGAGNTLAVDAAVSSRFFTNTNFAALKVKDAIADRFVDRTGKRPSVDTAHPDFRINLHIEDSSCSVALDSSGESLHRRGYRLEKNEAPLSEVLAAGLLLLAGWEPELPLLDPMCGSGTFLAEAGMMACRIPPGAFRRHYGFFTWKNFDRPLWNKIKAESISRRRPLPAEIRGSDADPNAVEVSKANLTRAGLHKEIKVSRAVFENTSSNLAEGEKGFLIMNPPYGKRLADEEINSLYSRIGDTLKRGYPGYRAWIFSSNLEAIKHIGLRPFVRIPLKNGPLDTRLLGFEMFPRNKEA